MKVSNSHLYILLVAVSLVLFSCGEDDPEDLAPLPTGPSSFAANPDTTSAAAGETITINLTATSNNQFVALYVSEFNAGVQDTIALSGNSVDLFYDYTVPSTAVVGDVVEIFYSVEDTDGSLYQAFTSTYITVSGTVFQQEFAGEIWHISGAGAGSWDLVNNEALFLSSSTAAERDMRNNSMNNMPFTSGFEAESTTSFLQDNSFNWNNATQESVNEVCEAGTPSTSITGLNEGDIVIAQLRNLDHAVILITGVYPDSLPDGASTNPGLLTFVYKKP